LFELKFDWELLPEQATLMQPDHLIAKRAFPLNGAQACAAAFVVRQRLHQIGGASGPILT
jgi:hypothetical protein